LASCTIKIDTMQTDNRIFIVDDDPFWTAMLSEMLTGLGFSNMLAFENGADTVNNLHLNPKLVFLDYEMEGINGLQVLQQIKNYYPGIGVIFCTAHEDLGLAVNAMKFGSFDYLLKENASKKEINSIIYSMTEKQVFADKIL
jgi:DNA-binding NtrC family response regulator